jgi:1,4-alpha-glucan branching enzyme
MSMTPPLVSMLRDPLLQERYDEHLSKLEELIELEIEHNEHKRSYPLLSRTLCQ